MPRSFRLRVFAALSLAALAAVLALALGDSVAVIIAVAVLLVASASLGLAAVAAVGGEARMLAGAAREIGQGELAARLGQGPDDELGLAYDEFNRMASQLESRRPLRSATG